MRKKLLALCCVFALGIFGMCHADDAKMSPIKVEKNSKSIQLKDLLTTKKSFAPSVGKVIFSTDGTIHFLKAYFYDSTNSDCTGTLTLLGAVSVLDNGAGFPFTNGQTISFNGDAAYALIQNTGQAITDSSVKCMHFFTGGGNDTDNRSNCLTLPVTCSPSSCATSNLTPNAIGWNSSFTGCFSGAGPSVPSYFYIVERSNSTVKKCTVLGIGTTLNCIDSGAGAVFPNGVDISINNGYAYVTTTNAGTGGVVKCVVNAADGSLSGCVSSPISSVDNFSYLGIELNGGFIYVANSGLINYTGVSATDGSFSPTADSISDSNSNGITINNSLAYFKRTTTDLSYYTVDPSDGSLTLGGTSVSATGIISMDTNNGMAYYTRSTDRSINYCTNTAGTFSSCSAIDLNAEVGISGVMHVIIHNGYAYITAFNGGGGQVVACLLNGDGTITGSNCSLATLNGDSLTSPFGMAVY